MGLLARHNALPLFKRLVVEFVGTTILLATVVGSRVIGDRISSGIPGVTFLVNSLATGAMAVALLLTFGPLCGAHFNPAVTFGAMLRERLPVREAAAYVLAQLAGAFAGAGAAVIMLGHPVFRWSNPPRATVTEIVGELLGTFGLLCVIAGGARLRSGASAFAVGAYLTCIYWFTESTSFANPAVAIAKGLTDTSSSIHPKDISLILSAQLLGAAVSGLLFRWLLPSKRRASSRAALVVFACHEGGLLARLAVRTLEDVGTKSSVEGLALTPDPTPSPALERRLAEVGARLAPAPAMAWDEALLNQADLIVTLGARPDWAALMDGENVHWELPRLAELDDHRLGELTEGLRVRVRLLLRELGLERVRLAPVRSAPAGR